MRLIQQEEGQEGYQFDNYCGEEHQRDLFLVRVRDEDIVKTIRVPTTDPASRKGLLFSFSLMNFTDLRHTERQVKAHYRESEKKEQASEGRDKQCNESLAVLVELEAMVSVHGLEQPEALRKVVPHDYVQPEHQHRDLNRHD